MNQQVIDYLNQREGFEEAASLTMYEVYVHSRAVTVQVRDHGDGVGHTRFAVAAFFTGTPEDDQSLANPKYTLGNPAATLEEALGEPHWWIFNSEE